MKARNKRYMQQVKQERYFCNTYDIPGRNLVEKKILKRRGKRAAQLLQEEAKNDYFSNLPYWAFN